MSMEWVRASYGVPAKRGGRVRLGPEFTSWAGREGTITSADHRLRARLDGDKSPIVLHPTWALEYLT
jgi:acyl dehydratase